MARSLHMIERFIPADERSRYLDELAHRRAQAAAAKAHFWAFEHAAHVGRFVEFTEAPSEEALAAVCGHAEGAVTDRWTEVRIPS
jgi:hypothetical protein